MKKCFRSKKGLTLVELVVTIAILGIVSGFSLAIVVTAMNNYSHAAIIEREQETALMLEEYITRNARVAQNVEFIVKDGSGSANTRDEIPHTSNVGSYLAKIDDVIQTFEYEGTSEKYTHITYKDVKNITFYIGRQKFDKDEADIQSSFYLNYHIEMSSGYTLDGQAVLNNAKKDDMNTIVPTGTEPGQPAKFVDKQANPWNLIDVTGDETSDVLTISPSYDAAIVFK